VDIAFEQKARTIWYPNFVETTDPRSQFQAARSLAVNPSGTFMTAWHGDAALGARWHVEDLTVTGVDATFQILTGLLLAEMAIAHPYLSSTPLAEHPILQRNQQALTLLAIEQAVVGEYAPIPQVALIYSDRYLDEHVFTLFVTGNQYDDAVMDALLDREIAILKRFAQVPLTFHYIPYSQSALRREMVRETARLIFEG
jgi:hypothetical protein